MDLSSDFFFFVAIQFFCELFVPLPVLTGSVSFPALARLSARASAGVY